MMASMAHVKQQPFSGSSPSYSRTASSSNLLMSNHSHSQILPVANATCFTDFMIDPQTSAPFTSAPFQPADSSPSPAWHPSEMHFFAPIPTQTAQESSNPATSAGLSNSELLGSADWQQFIDPSLHFKDLAPVSSNPVPPVAPVQQTKLNGIWSPSSSSGGLGLAVDPAKGGLSLQGISNCFADFPSDPGFAERAARMASFSSGNFSQANQGDGYRSQPASPNKGNRPSPAAQKEAGRAGDGSSGEFFSSEQPKNGRLGSRSPSPKALPSKCTNEASEQEFLPSPEASSNGGEQTGPKTSLESQRKRKSVEDKLKDSKNSECEEAKPKKAKACDSAKEEGVKPKLEKSSSENSGNSSPRSNKETSKPPEPPKDYIHVRARRGQATDSHSLAERVRREKISERMKFLQDLVPGCSKVTGKAVMLDEIINYVQSLQRQVEFLSMRLAAINPRLDFNLDAFQQVMHSRAPPAMVLGSELQNTYAHLQQQLHHTQQAVMQLGVSSPLDLRSLASPVEAGIRRIPVGGASLSNPEAFGDASSQISGVWDGELQSIVQMSFGPMRSCPLSSQELQGHLPAGHMKVEI